MSSSLLIGVDNKNHFVPLFLEPSFHLKRRIVLPLIDYWAFLFYFFDSSIAVVIQSLAPVVLFWFLVSGKPPPALASAMSDTAGEAFSNCSRAEIMDPTARMQPSHTGNLLIYVSQLVLSVVDAAAFSGVKKDLHLFCVALMEKVDQWSSAGLCSFCWTKLIKEGGKCQHKYRWLHPLESGGEELGLLTSINTQKVWVMLGTPTCQ